MGERLFAGGKVKRSDIITLMIILFPLCNLSDNTIINYYDEIIAVFSLLVVIYNLLRRKVSTYDKVIIVVLVIITLVGLFSNLVSELITEILPIAVDVLWLWKPFAIYIAFKLMADEDVVREKVKRKLLPFAKLAIWVLFFTSIIGQFVDIGVNVSSTTSYISGLNAFGFFWQNGIQVGWLAFSSLLVISSIETAKNTFTFYLVVAIVPMFLTSSALVMCWIVVEVMLLVLLRSRERLTSLQLIIVVVVLVAVVSTEAEEYFAEGLRGEFYEYAVVVANRYFPFGSGFATYGTEMAARYYSQLYIEFGWQESWALGEESSFLNDNFFASIIGQFGWISFALYLICLVMMFKQVNSDVFYKRERITLIATVITIIAVMTGSASAKSIMGVFTFAVLGVISSKNKVGTGRERLENQEDLQAS